MENESVFSTLIDWKQELEKEKQKTFEINEIELKQQVEAFKELMKLRKENALKLQQKQEIIQQLLSQ